MPELLLKMLDCESTDDWLGADDCELALSVDGGPWQRRVRHINTGEHWLLNWTLSFKNYVHVRISDQDSDSPDDVIGDFTITSTLTHRAAKECTYEWAKQTAAYHLWYEVTDSPDPHHIHQISLRDMFGRLGKGVLSAAEYADLQRVVLYQCVEVISIRNAYQFHQQQDQGRSASTSLRKWVDLHCNPWGEETVVPAANVPRMKNWKDFAGGTDQWPRVNDDRSVCLAGLQGHSFHSSTDFPFHHETIDWNWDVIPDPAFLYLCTYSAKRRTLLGTTHYPCMENELENGSMPVEWRPFPGEYVSTWGRHIYDAGHMPITTEIHPAHTIVREHTSAANLGDGGALVPINRVIIGMGLSGGFPGYTGLRWQRETGSNPPSGVYGDTEDCWATDLRKHPLRIQIFPPVPRPSSTAVLRARITLCEYIPVPNWQAADDFLERCQEDDPAAGGVGLGFRVWDRNKGLPVGFTPQLTPAQFQPRLIAQKGYFEAEVDLSQMSAIPAAYYAMIECGWSERGNHSIYEFEVTFESMTARDLEGSTDEPGGEDWHMFYGVNGQWAAWWTENMIKEDGTYNRGTVFKVFTVDNQPLVIRDCGIDWDSMDFWNETLDHLEIAAPGPQHLETLATHKGIHTLSKSSDQIRFVARAYEMAPGETKHEWTIRVGRSQR